MVGPVCDDELVAAHSVSFTIQAAAYIQDRLLLFQHTKLTPEPGQLSAIAGGQFTRRTISDIDLCVLDPGHQRLLADLQIASDLTRPRSPDRTSSTPSARNAFG